MPSSRWGQRARQNRISRLLLGVVLAVSGPVVAAAVPAEAATLEAGYRDHNYSTLVTAPTGQKPQSKLWFADGVWWGILWDTPSRRFTIHRFNLATQATDAWTSTGVLVDTRRNSQADALWHAASQKLYVLMHLKDTDTSTTTDPSIKVLRYGYSAGTYTLESSTTLARQKVEAAVLDRDSSGKLWATYTEPTSGGAAEVKVTHSTTSDSEWTDPFTLPVPGNAATVNPDDISTIVAFGDRGERKIGVLWSNELHSSLYFASHVDGQPDDVWELSALCNTTRCWDDHLNIKSIDADTSGNLFAVIKTSLNDGSSPNPDDPLIVVYRLNPDGTWSSSVAWTVGEGNMTRAIVVLDTHNRRVHSFAAGPCCSGGTVYTKNASFDALDFPRGLGTPFIRSATVGENVNNPTSTKQTVNPSSGLLVLAGIDSTRDYVHNYLPLPADATGPEVVEVSPAAGSIVATSSPVTATFSEAVAPTSVSATTFTLRDGNGKLVPASVGYHSSTLTATLTPDGPLEPGTSYTATVKGGPEGVVDLAGNPLVADQAWAFTTASDPGPSSETVRLPVVADTYVSDTAPGSNFGRSSLLSVDKKPVELTYLKVDLSAFAGRPLLEATLNLRVSTSGSKGMQTVKLVTDDSWTEHGLTYVDRPALGRALGSFGPTVVSTEYRVVLDRTVVAPELGDWLSLGVDSSSSDGVELSSRETAYPPTLELVLGPAEGPDTVPPTVVEVSPGDGATDVPVDGDVSATFSELLDPSSVSNATVLLRGPDSAAVPASVSYTDLTRTATLHPASDLAQSTSYTATVKSGPDGVRDKAGNALVSDHSWSFTTAARPAGQRVILSPTADAYVTALKPNLNYGGDVQLRVDKSPTEVTYVRFDLARYAGRTIEEAALEVTTTASGSKGVQDLRLVADDAWGEQTLTYANAPSRGAVLGTLGPTAPTRVYAVALDVGLVDAAVGGRLNIGLDSKSSDGVVIGARESGTPPRLVLVLGPE